MRYDFVEEATFINRPNRFIARVLYRGREETVHVKNTGRCRELLVPGCRVYLSYSDNPDRKTRFDLVAVEKERRGKTSLLINMDSQAPNAAAEEFLLSGGLIPGQDFVKREVRYGASRFDFYLEKGERRAFVEVKGVTLEENGVALFPDAPTHRGVKHLEELCRAFSEGYEAYILFLIQMKGVRRFVPNDRTHPAFGDALRRAAALGVTVLARDCLVTPGSVTVDRPVPVQLGEKK